MGPLHTLCLVGAPLFLAAVIAGYFVCEDETPEDGSRNGRE